jgi:hypothetical protein
MLLYINITLVTSNSLTHSYEAGRAAELENTMITLFNHASFSHAAAEDQRF